MGAPVRPARQRLPDWQLRLAALVEDRLHAPFEWGLRDCCLWAADCVQAVTGVDPAQDIRGQYASRESASAVFRRLRGLERACAGRLGAWVLPALAQPGDVGMTQEAEGPALVVHVGSCWMAQSARGLVPVRDAAVLRAWRCC